MMELLQVFTKLGQFPACSEPPGEVPATLLGCLCCAGSRAELSISTND